MQPKTCCGLGQLHVLNFYEQAYLLAMQELALLGMYTLYRPFKVQNISKSDYHT